MKLRPGLSAIRPRINALYSGADSLVHLARALLWIAGGLCLVSADVVAGGERNLHGPCRNPFSKLFTIDIDGQLKAGTPTPAGVILPRRIRSRWGGEGEMPQGWEERYINPYDALEEGKARPLVVLEKTFFPYRGIRGERLHYQGKTYWLVNIGDHQALADRAFLDPMWAKATGDRPYQITELFFTGKKAEAIEFLRERRRLIESKVTDTYQNTKGYLPHDDFVSIHLSDHYDSNADVFVVLQDRGVEPHRLSVAQFGEDSLMTLRISRTDKKFVHGPSVLDHNSDRFLSGTPVTVRMNDQDKVAAIEEKLKSIGPPRGRAELTRYARFGEVPAPIRDAMLYRAFSAAKEKGYPIDVFLASMDQAIRDYLAPDWKFNELMRLPTGQSVEPEYLMYLKTDSREYDAAVEGFRKSANEVWSSGKNLSVKKNISHRRPKQP